MFPLKQRKLIRGCQAHINAGLGCGADYVATVGTPLYAPSDGKITRQYTGKQGGNWLWFDDKNGNSLQFAHLSKYVGLLRTVKRGDLIAYTGNTGSITTGPHLHVQILKGNTRLDPEKYPWVIDSPAPPPNTEPMNFGLYQETGKPEVYMKVWRNKNLLIHIPTWEDLVDHWGNNPTIKKVENIRAEGTVVEGFITNP